MKKVFQSAMILSLVFLSCTDEVDRTENITGVVGFHTADVPASRAAILTDLKPAGFLVNAYSTGTGDWASVGSATTPGFMYNQPVTWNSGAWTYGTAKYWPGNNGMISFFAWNEGTGATVSGNDKTGAPTLTYTVPNTHADQKDLVTAMVADQTANTNNGAVALSFGHVLSRIGFTARLEEHYDDVTITVTSLKVRYAAGAVKSSGVYTFGSGWNLSGTTDYMSHTGDGDVLVDAPGVELDNGATPAKTDLTTAVAANYLMLLPQTVDPGDVTIDVAWTVDDGVGIGGPYYETIPLPTQIWLPGKCYDYSLKVSLTGITLDPVLVDPWGDDDLYKPCTITYKANDGTGEDIVEYRTTNVTYPVGGQYFGREYYRFLAWNTAADGTGTTYRADDNITCPGPGNLTLYAQWRSTLPNCYMVKPAGQVTFPVMLAYEDNGASTTLRIGGTHTGEFTIEEVWDPDNLVTATVTGEGRSAMVNVTTASGSGNALVAIKAGSDIAWSYHIWVTTYEGEDPILMKNGHKFMDRNLGATTNDLATTAEGLFYQWGRKDPFPHSDAAKTEASSNATGTIPWSIKNPDTFITGNDWLYRYDYYLWEEQTSGHKTIYDPCPAGWRVPAYLNFKASVANSPWWEYDDGYYTSGLKSRTWGNGGYKFTHLNERDIFYPSSGRLYHTDGTFGGDDQCYYWGATKYSPYAAYVYMNYMHVYSMTAVSQAYGFSVRCVQE